jgi:uncharacterized membrane protein
MSKQTARDIGLVGLFDSPEPLLRAARLLRDARCARWDCHTPYPVHGLPRAMGLKASPVAIVTMTFAFLGLAAAVLLTGGLSVIQYPIVIGGKPLFSWLAFVPIFFEMFVLFATVSTLVALIVLCRLGRWHSPLHDSDVARLVTCDRFAVVWQGQQGPPAEAGPSHEQVRGMLQEAGCTDIRPLIELDEPSDILSEGTR